MPRARARGARPLPLPPRLWRGPAPCLRRRQVGLALLDQDGLLPREVLHLDHAGLHLEEGALAALLGEPLRAAHRPRPVPPARAEAALAAAPEVPAALGRRQAGLLRAL